MKGRAGRFKSIYPKGEITWLFIRILKLNDIYFL